MRATFVVTVLMVAIAGCQETQHCGEGVYGRNCDQFLTMQPDSGDRDGGMDAGTDDVGVDAFVPRDAGPCGEMCPIDRPECFIAPAGADSGHASGCVECLDRSDCMTDGGAGGEFICEDFECVFGCENDADCEGNFCRPDHTCSMFPAYSATEAVCAPCDTDGNCAAAENFYCIAYRYQNGSFVHDGNYCLRASDACGAATSPLARQLAAPPPMSVDGFDTSAGVCRPRTSCEALTDAAESRTCGSDDGCGLATTADGVCDLGRSACTLVCTDSTDCPDSLTSCIGTPLTCSP